MVGFLNANQGFVMALLTAVYAIATIFICLANIHSAKATRDQNTEQQRQFEESRRPLLEGILEIRGRHVGLLFKNNGGGSAYNISYDFPDEFIVKVKQLCDGEFFAKLIEQRRENKLVLLVGQEDFLFLYSLAEGKEGYELFENEVLHIPVTYSDHSGTTAYQDTLLIDFRAHGALYYTPSSEEKTAEELRGVRKELKAISAALEKQVR